MSHPTAVIGPLDLISGLIIAVAWLQVLPAIVTIFLTVVASAHYCVMLYESDTGQRLIQWIRTKI